jgi:hypothetical protein
MPKRKENINQHYVPQFYLRNFTNEKGKIHVYDINRGNKYVTTPKNESYIAYFYDINPTILKQFSNYTENYTELIDDNIRVLNESVSSILFNYLKDEVGQEMNFNFPRAEREKLYDFIILQIIRTPFYRDRLEYLISAFTLQTDINNSNDLELLKTIHNLFILGIIEKLYDLDFKLNKKYHIFFDHLISETLNNHTQLSNAGKILLVNKSKDSFICANTPLSIRWKPDFFANHKALVAIPNSDIPVRDIGNNIEFLSIHLPISSKLSIFIFDKTLNTNLSQMNQGVGKIEEWNSDLLLNLNYISLMECSDKIYSRQDNFDKLIEMFSNKQNPRLNFRF